VIILKNTEAFIHKAGSFLGLRSGRKNNRINVGGITVEKNDVIEKAVDLMKRSKIAYVGSIGPGGFPNIKAMLNLDPESLARVMFSTNASSKRVAQFVENPRACVYFCDEGKFEGLLLVGSITVTRDADARKRLWRAGFEMYYPHGVDDPDYSVFDFRSESVNYYHGLANVTFDPRDI
jgi:general stress protein 26